MRYHRAFTLIEILTIVSVIAIIAAITGVGYGSWQRHQATSSVNSDVLQAISGLQSFKNFRDSYPPNLAGTGFASSSNVALTLSTNSPSVGVYENLTNAQNAQLFLNSCNANLFATPNNTTCSFEGSKSGAKIHAKGTSGSNAIWDSPILPDDLILDCGDEQSECDQAIETMKLQFIDQGGVFPIIVPDNNQPLPEPTQIPNGPADRYCLEGRSTNFPDIVFYVNSEDQIVNVGECPNDPELHYYQ